MHGKSRNSGRQSAFACLLSPASRTMPRWADKHREIATRKSELDRELSATDTAIARGLVSHRQRQVEQQAKAIIDGNAGEAFHGFEELRARQARLSDEARAYGEAIRMLRAQMDEIRAERSIDAVEIAAPHHRRAIAKLADSCAALLSALREEEMIRGMVISEGYDARLPDFNVATPAPQLEQLAREYLG